MPNSSMFNLGGFISRDLIDENIDSIDEGTEFAPKSNATNDVSNHTSSAKVSVPGGDSESPKSKPEGGEKGPTPPGGNSEKPSVKSHEFGPSAPQKTELSTAQWMKAMSDLRNSFKEHVDMMDQFLNNCTIVEETVVEKQQRYLQEAVEDAWYEAMVNGPLFEAVDNENKDSIKKIAKNMKGKVAGYCKKNDIQFRPINKFAKFFKVDWFQTRMWQVVGAIYTEGGSASAVSAMNKEFATDLGDFKLLASGAYYPDAVDLFKTKFGWDKQNKITLLIVDKELPSEFSKENQGAKSENDVKTESCKSDKDCDDKDKKDKKCNKCGKSPCECEKDED